MLWINLIMDTFAAMALASLPPSHDVMKDKPRDRRAFIISPSMKKNILIAGLSFFFFLWGLLYIFQHAQIEHMSDLLDFTFTENHNLSGNELSLFFTTFVALQIWNLLNVRAFMTKTSAFQLKGCQGFLLIFLIILIGQILIVSFGGDFFSVKRISLSDWLIIFGVTSIVLWIGEIIRWFERHQTQIHPIPTHE
jgi:Ca2+-transporting ATPase